MRMESLHRSVHVLEGVITRLPRLLRHRGVLGRNCAKRVHVSHVAARPRRIGGFEESGEGGGGGGLGVPESGAGDGQPRSEAPRLLLLRLDGLLRGPARLDQAQRLPRRALRRSCGSGRGCLRLVPRLQGLSIEGTRGRQRGGRSESWLHSDLSRQPYINHQSISHPSLSH